MNKALLFLLAIHPLTSGYAYDDAESIFDCRKYPRRMSKHGVGCNQWWWQCMKGETSKGHCGGDLYYDPDSERCVQKEKVKACSGVQLEQGIEEHVHDVPEHQKDFVQKPNVELGNEKSTQPAVIIEVATREQAPANQNEKEEIKLPVTKEQKENVQDTNQQGANSEILKTAGDHEPKAEVVDRQSLHNTDDQKSDNSHISDAVQAAVPTDLETDNNESPEKEPQQKNQPTVSASCACRVVDENSPIVMAIIAVIMIILPSLIQ